jgi:hypothetical protein
MATIIPGYDFQISEVPTFGKFIAQAQGLNITDLSYTDLEDDTSFIFNSDESLGSGASVYLSAEGAMWSDPTGEMWINIGVYGWWGSSGYSGDTYAQCPMFKPWRGGWSTIRGMRHPGGSNRDRLVAVASGTVANGYSPTNLARETNHFQHNTNGPRDLGYADDTPVSGVYFTVSGRGGVNFVVDRTIEDNSWNTYRWTMSSPTAYDIRNTTDPGAGGPHPQAVGEVYLGNMAILYNSNWTAEGMGWFWGRVAAYEGS